MYGQHLNHSYLRKKITQQAERSRQVLPSEASCEILLEQQQQDDRHLYCVVCTVYYFVVILSPYNTYLFRTYRVYAYDGSARGIPNAVCFLVRRFRVAFLSGVTFVWFLKKNLNGSKSSEHPAPTHLNLLSMPKDLGGNVDCRPKSSS